MSACFIAPIVEGKGEVEAVPKLLQRLFRQARRHGFLVVNPAIRIKAGSFLNDEGYFRRYVELASPEIIRGAKEWLAARLPNGYDAPNHQPLFTGHFSFAQAAAVPSFARLQRKTQALFSA